MSARRMVMVSVIGLVMALCATASAKVHTLECAGVSFEAPDNWVVEPQGAHIAIKSPEKGFHFLIMCVKGQEKMGKAVEVFKKVYVEDAISFQVTLKDRTKYKTKGQISYSITGQKAVYKVSEAEDAATFTASIRSYFMLPDLDHIVYITDFRLVGGTAKDHDKVVEDFINSFERLK